MTDAVRERCELLVNNRAAIRMGFLLEKRGRGRDLHNRREGSGY